MLQFDETFNIKCIEKCLSLSNCLSILMHRFGLAVVQNAFQLVLALQVHGNGRYPVAGAVKDWRFET